MHRINELYIIIISFAVPSKPTSFEIVSVTASSVTVQWKPPQTTNDIIFITRYSVQYGKNDVINDFGEITSDTMTGTIEGLSPDTKYALKLKAHTRVGAGPPACVNVKTSKLIIQLLCTYVVS